MKSLLVAYLFSLSVSFSPAPSSPIMHPEPGIPIPELSEQLKPLEPLKIPDIQPVAPIEPVYAAQKPKVVSAPSQAVYGANTYDYGYCTWYVANRRSVPNGLGDAITWVSRAAAMGMATGSVPRVGAVAQKDNHVAYVEEVGNGLMTISEMNYVGWNITTSRTISPVGWSFIY